MRCRRSFLQHSLAVAAILWCLLALGSPRVVSVPQSIEGVPPSNGIPSACSSARLPYAGAGSNCPAGSAFFGVDDPAGRNTPTDALEVRASCCPLPSADILLHTFSYASQTCPENTVVTGTRRASTGKIELRCSELNTARYGLGPATKALYWGAGASGWTGATRIAWNDIPPAIRAAEGREGPTRWDVDGCVGFPWGSLLVARTSKHCSGMMFRQLHFRGAPGDPPMGTPVQMVPKSAN